MKLSSLSLRSMTFRIATVVFLAASGSVSAGVLNQFKDGSWTLAGEADGYVGPGAGGQLFDAEYLFYKQSGTVLTIGLQAGFDLRNLANGYLHTDHRRYYAGDLALSFDNTPTTYEYAVDFGLKTLDYYGHNVGLGSGNTDPAGLYRVSAWNNQIAFPTSSPFAMDAGTWVVGLNKIGGVTQNFTGSGYPTSGPAGKSYYRIVSFDLAGLGLGDNLSAHWTMSCGNDVIGGRGTVTHKVPEPSTLVLLGAGLLGISVMRRRRMRHTMI